MTLAALPTPVDALAPLRPQAVVKLIGRETDVMPEPDVRWLQRLDNYKRALATLQRAIALAAERDLSELEEQGLLKDFLADLGVSGISGSRDAVREAVVRELLSPGSEATWMAMIRSRNLTSHTYNPSLAKQISALIVERRAAER